MYYLTYPVLVTALLVQLQSTALSPVITNCVVRHLTLISKQFFYIEIIQERIVIITSSPGLTCSLNPTAAPHQLSSLTCLRGINTQSSEDAAPRFCCVLNVQQFSITDSNNFNLITCFITFFLFIPF